jgi:hypothetical protein
MPTQLKPAVVDYIRYRIGDRCLVETVDTHGVADLDNGRTAFLAEQPLCISTPCGMAVCGRTALHSAAVSQTATRAARRAVCELPDCDGVSVATVATA